MTDPSHLAFAETSTVLSSIPLTAWIILAITLACSTSAFIKWKKHPLAPIPGPLSATFSNALYSWNFMGGRRPWKELELHDKYGPVVRVAPNEVSFNTASSWRDIYGVRKDTKTFVKSEFYEGGNFAAEATSIVSERSPQAHAEMRRYLASAFSDRSLKAQEPLIAAVVDEFIEQIGIKGKEGLDLVLWFNLTTFDIIGSLAFGQDFGGVKSGTHHFWVSIVVKSLGLGALADCFKRFPWAAKCFLTLFPGLLKKLTQDTRRHEAYTMDLVKKRIANPTGRTDFLTKILESRKEANIQDIQLAAHSSDFVIAGSETTATALSTATYYLLRHPAALRRLQDEVRGTFQKYDEITAASTTGLGYLKAVVLEAMRMYPPLPFSLPRVVPDGGVTVDGCFLPEGTIVSTSPFAACMSSQNFKDPWEFQPERWIGENLNDNLDASQPFSLGTRGCMGRSLGWIELQTIMAKLHFKYDLTLLDDAMDWQKDSRMYTLWEKPSLMVKALPRE